jgi:hypothetical protein
MTQIDVDPFADMIDTNTIEWIPLPAPLVGNAIKPLRISRETGDMSILFKMDAGTREVRHRHIGPANFLVLSGIVEIWGKQAGPGTWMYEPAGALHEGTSFPVETVVLSNSQGPITVLDDDDNVLGVVDWQVIQSIVDAHNAAHEPVSESAA